MFNWLRNDGFFWFGYLLYYSCCCCYCVTYYMLWHRFESRVAHVYTLYRSHRATGNWSDTSNKRNEKRESKHRNEHIWHACLAMFCVYTMRRSKQNKTKRFVLYANEVGIEHKVNIYTQQKKSKHKVKNVHIMGWLFHHIFSSLTFYFQFFSREIHIWVDMITTLKLALLFDFICVLIDCDDYTLSG